MGLHERERVKQQSERANRGAKIDRHTQQDTRNKTHTTRHKKQETRNKRKT
jgi:hypothetical protein